MNTTTVSKKYVITLPREVCEQVNFRPGEKALMTLNRGQLSLTPIRTAVDSTPSESALTATRKP